jgi:hypothetical protein
MRIAMRRIVIGRILAVSIGTILIVLAFAPASMAQVIPGLPGLGGPDIGTFSVGLGMYQAPSGAESDSGAYALARYAMTNLQFEVDLGLNKQNFFLGSADYLYFIPTAEGITQTSIGVGGGITFVANDPGEGDSQFGPNVLARVGFMDTYSLQLRYDFHGDKSNLWTLGLTYDLN